MDFDVLIIGAGISGIGAAYRIHEKNPNLTYAVLERRARIGGTWDLNRYPGIRSDSDIFTLSYPFEPWRRPENVADGEDIREYLVQTARKHGIEEHIRFNTRVLSADWDSSTDTWTVRTDHDGDETTYRCRFLFFGTGYYNYDEPYRPDFPGLEQFSGEVIHPQHWPESLDYTGKKLVVIGSGATAVSMIPSLTEKAGHVTMLQRSPTYILSTPRINPIVQFLRTLLPGRLGYSAARLYNTFSRWSSTLSRGRSRGSAGPTYAAARNVIYRRAIRSTRISSHGTTRGINDCAPFSTTTSTKRSRTAAWTWSPTRSTTSTPPESCCARESESTPTSSFPPPGFSCRRSAVSR